MSSSMSTLRTASVLAGMLLVSACNRPDADQAAANGAMATDEAIEDADTRAAHLAEEAQVLNAEAERAKGARREALENQSRDEMSDAVNVEQAGAADAQNIARSSEAREQDVPGR